MLDTSFSEESGSMGTATLPNDTIENRDMVQFGMFWDRIAILSPALRLYLENRCPSSITLALISEYVYLCPPSTKLRAVLFGNAAVP